MAGQPRSRTGCAERPRATAAPDRPGVRVEVVARLRMREPEILRFVEQHRDWVLDKVSRLRRTHAPIRVRSGSWMAAISCYAAVRWTRLPATGVRATVRYQDGFESLLPVRVPDEERERWIEAASALAARRRGSMPSA